MNIEVADHGDNTGATVTIAGNTGVASIYVSRFAGTNASRAFVLADSITGDGTVELPDLETGPYIAVAVNSVPELSEPVFFRVSDETDAMHMRVLEAVREYVLSLSLPSVSTDPDDHAIVKLPYRMGLELSIDLNSDCCIYYFPKAETYTPANNEDDTVAYSVQVLLARRTNKMFDGLETMLKDRQLLAQSMSRVPLPDLCEIYSVEIQPGAIYMPEHWANTVDCSSIVLRCLTEQASGIF